MDPLFTEKSHSLAEECSNADNAITFCLYPMIKIPRNLIKIRLCAILLIPLDRFSGNFQVDGGPAFCSFLTSWSVFPQVACTYCNGSNHLVSHALTKSFNKDEKSARVVFTSFLRLFWNYHPDFGCCLMYYYPCNILLLSMRSIFVNTPYYSPG